jgi:tetratricopeptide (TPR) repeat protein
VGQANREAVAYFEQALIALQHLPESHDTLTLAIDLRLDLRQSLYPLGEFARILDYLREAEIFAKALGEQNRLGWIAAYMLNYLVITGKPDRAIEIGQRALGIGEAAADFAVLDKPTGRWVILIRPTPASGGTWCASKVI